MGTRILTALSGLLLGVLLAERRRRRQVQGALDEHLRFERLLAELQTSFGSLRPWEVGSQIEAALGKALDVLGVDRAALAEISSRRTPVQFSYRALRPGIPAMPNALAAERFPWMIERLRRGESVTFVRPEELPDEAATDRQSFRDIRTRSLAAVPLVVGGAVVGALRFGTTTRERDWSSEFVEQLRVLAEIFGNALARRQADEALRESEALRSAIFGSLYGRVAAIDRTGVIIAVNEAWTAAVQEFGADPSRTAVGANYLDVCAKSLDDADARRAFTAIEDTLAGRADHTSIEYPCHGPTEQRWFEMVVEPLRRPEGGAVISHIDITTRRRLEAEARAQHEALAHALRLTTVGELVASMAHELSQPLTAIVTTAGAAKRIADTPGRGREEIAEALDAVVTDGRRAIEVIRRLRALFRKDSAEHKPVQVNDVIREVIGLIGRDASRRGVAMDLALAGPLPPVLGDWVQLQQVVLNLLVNAMDAMVAVDEPRTITVATMLRERAMVEVTVRDRGVGVPPSQLKAMFDPFVTTKPDGLGMGLAISRSIVLSHGGRIWATANEDRGLTVHFTVPCD
jgi:C4-dicarboxylate-specific signal transduction histidine kinase